jgi:predicted NAD-dependent protein-ADP-ribosyltransferase YbiA (DUF1768 family)
MERIARRNNKGRRQKEDLNTIVIKHANDKPFGPLRNDYKSDLFIDGKRWNSVNNYVYANLLPSIDFRKKSIEHVNPSNVEKSYYEVKFEIDKSTLSSAIKIGIESKLSVDNQFRQALLDTAGNTILYLSKNNYLGYGNGKGFVNTYGIWLEHFRTSMLWSKAQVGRHPTLKDDQIYDSYLAEKGLKLALHYENLDKYLKIDSVSNTESEGMVQIIKALIKKYGREKIFVIDRETALALQRRRHIEPITKATNLIRYIRKTSIRDVKNTNLQKLKERIFEAFVDDLMDSSYDDEEFERGDAGYDDKRAIMKNQFKTISIAEKNSLIQRTMKLYEAGALNQKVMTKANLIFKDIYIPSSTEINQYENDTVPIPVAKPKNPHVDEPALDFNELKVQFMGGGQYVSMNLGMTWVYPNFEDKPITFGNNILEHKFEWDLLSPANDSVMLRIEDKLYPSISHYLIVRIAQTIPGYEGIEKAYSVISAESGKSFFSVTDSESRLNQIERMIYTSEKNNLLETAIRHKFEQRMFKDILIATGDKTLKYSSLKIEENPKHQGFWKPLNIILDSEEYSKQSTVFMQKVRNTILPEEIIFKGDIALKISLEYDEFMENFMIEKIKDISFTIKCVQIFLKNKKMSYKLTKNFIKNVLESFYGNCTPFDHSKSKSDKKLLKYPYRFEKTLSSQFQIKNKKESSFSMSTKSAQLIFNKILNTLLNLQDVLKSGELPRIGENEETPLYATLFKIALIDSQWLLFKKDKRKDLKFDTKSKKNNNIISAIINVIYLLHRMQINFKENSDESGTDSDTETENSFDAFIVKQIDVKIATSILTGEIQSITELKTTIGGSLRSQFLAEEQLRDEIDDIQDNNFIRPQEQVRDEQENDMIYEDDLDIEEIDQDNEEEIEETEGIDYQDELPEFDEEAYYEGTAITIKGHLESMGLTLHNLSIENDIKNAAQIIAIKGNKLKINFYS